MEEVCWGSGPHGASGSWGGGPDGWSPGWAGSNVWTRAVSLLSLVSVNEQHQKLIFITNYLLSFLNLTYKNKGSIKA